MKKNFLDELIEELQKLKAEQETASVGKVISVVLKTAAGGQLTYEQKRVIAQAAMSLDGLTPEEAEILRDWEEAKKTED